MLAIYILLEHAFQKKKKNSKNRSQSTYIFLRVKKIDLKMKTNCFNEYKLSRPVMVCYILLQKTILALLSPN